MTNEKEKEKDIEVEAKVIKEASETPVAQEPQTPVQEEPATPVEEPSASPQQVNVMSQQDTLVSDLVKEAPTSVAAVAAKEVKMQNILELPEECAKLHKQEFRYRWMAKTKNLESKLRTSIWSLCTRRNSPYIKPTRFKSHGAVEQAGMLLAFCTEQQGRLREEAPAKESARRVKHYTEDLPTRAEKGFYKPEDIGEGDDAGEGFVMEN
jgi:hypothetical protein